MRAAIVLAAGRSRRFGGADKLFAPLAGVPLMLHAIRAAWAAPAARVIVATARPARVRGLVRAAGLRRITVVRVAAPGAPLSATLRAALAALRPIERDAFVFLGDMPGVDPALAERLARRLSAGAVAARPQHRGVPGHPVLVRAVRSRPLAGGDAGFRLDRARVAWIAGGSGCVGDIDRPEDLARLRRRLARLPRRRPDPAIAAGGTRLYAAGIRDS